MRVSGRVGPRALRRLQQVVERQAADGEIDAGLLGKLPDRRWRRADELGDFEHRRSISDALGKSRTGGRERPWAVRHRDSRKRCGGCRSGRAAAAFRRSPSPTGSAEGTGNPPCCRRLARPDRVLAPAPVEVRPGDRVDQQLRVGVLRLLDHHLDVARFHDRAAIEHDDVLAIW